MTTRMTVYLNPEGGEDAIVSTGEKNPQKRIAVTGL